ncbi:MAG: helix-turn-helix domain-containing protein [Elusimicrobia bacterium]|nr:helix-turn-helix domain-containing protein [Elusimicrobiota bacterium]
MPATLMLLPSDYICALRSALRMSQAQLARRCRIPRSHISRIEAGMMDPRMSTLRRIFHALFCGLLVMPIPRRHLGEALAERRLEGRPERKLWD